MAVYTEIGPDTLRQWLADNYDLPAPRTHAPIAEGIENSNYLLEFAGPAGGDGGPADPGDAAPSRTVLTVFEVWDAPLVENYAHLCAHLRSRGLPVPAPISRRDGSLVSAIEDKPAVLVPFASGRQAEAPTPRQCRTMGALLGRLHAGISGFDRHWENPRGLRWWGEALHRLDGRLPGAVRKTLGDEIEFVRARYPADAPRGICHCDLFKNNVLWSGPGEISAVIDFYFGGSDLFVFDLAVCANDWCVGPGERHDPARLEALFEGYQSVRRLEPTERESLAVVIRGAALRFWLSRLHDIHFPRRAVMLTPHDPGHFERVHQSCLGLADGIRRALGD